MKKEFTKEYILTHKSCYGDNDILDLFPASEQSVTLVDILKSGIPLGDKLFFLLKKCDLTIRQKHELMVSISSVVVDIYEKAYPNMKAASDIVDAANRFLMGNAELKELQAKKKLSSILLAVSTADTAKKNKPAYAKESAISLNSIIQSLDLSSVEQKYQNQFVDNAVSMAAKSATDAIADYKKNSSDGSEEFTQLITEKVIEFVNSQN